MVRLRTLSGVCSPCTGELRCPRAWCAERAWDGARRGLCCLCPFRRGDPTHAPPLFCPLGSVLPYSCFWGLTPHPFQGWVFAGAPHSDHALYSLPLGRGLPTSGAGGQALPALSIHPWVPGHGRGFLWPWACQRRLWSVPRLGQPMDTPPS